MFKKLIFTLSLIAAIGYVSAQSLQLELNGRVFANGETVQCTYVEEWGEYVQHFEVRNLTGNEVNVAVVKEVLENMEGSDVSFCWGGKCYSSSVFVSDPAAVPANTLSDMDMSLHAFLGEGDGKLAVRFTVFNNDQLDDKVFVDVVFDKNAGLSDKQFAGTLGHAYPNPASSVVRFNYEVSVSDNVSVAVYNLLGQEVMSEQLNGTHGQVSFPVSDLNEGIYFCNLTVNGRVMKTEKFVVKK